MTPRTKALIVMSLFARIAIAQIPDISPPEGFEPPRQITNITCQLMKESPEEAFPLGGVDLGSGHGSPTEVEWDCPGGLQSLSLLEPLAEMTEEIRGEGVLPQECTGSIVYALSRYYRFQLLQWGIAPGLAAEQQEKFFYRPESSRPTAMSYLEFWSYESYSNHLAYQRYINMLDAARPALIRHYKTAGHSESRASEFADKALQVYVERAGGSFPSSLVPEIQRKLAIVSRLRDANIAEEYLKTVDAKDIHFLLTTALLLKKPHRFVAELLKHVSDLNSAGESPLVYAMGDARVMQQLLKRGAHIDQPNEFGKTALFYAIETGDISLVKLLLQHGASAAQKYSTNTDDEGVACRFVARAGRTPLMHAAQHAEGEILRLLIDKGASLKDKDADGYMAVDYALLANRQDNIAILKAHQ